MIEISLITAMIAPVSFGITALALTRGNPVGAPAGEMGSCFGHLYLAGGNISECLVSGWTAGRRAVAERVQ